MSEHTPTPWVVCDLQNSFTGYDIAEQDSDGEFIACDVIHTDAKHIVHCVNIHDELVDALDTVLCSFDSCEENHGGSIDDDGTLMDTLSRLIEKAKNNG